MYPAGKAAVIVRALYGLKCSGASFRSHITKCVRIRVLFFQCRPCPLDEGSVPDTFEYYSCILYYVDDIVCIRHDPGDVLNKLNGYVPLKPRSVKSHNMYLGSKLK